MTLTLEPGHRAVVVGAAGTIGALICRAYAAAGAAVLALDLDKDRTRAVVAGQTGGPPQRPGRRACPRSATRPGWRRPSRCSALTGFPTGRRWPSTWTARCM